MVFNLPSPATPPPPPVTAAPTPAPTTGQLLTCSFETDKVNDAYCGVWFNDKTDPMDWTQAAPNAYSEIGTTADGAHYLYLNTAWAWTDESASLMSRPVQLGGGASLSFSYHMTGGSVGALKVGVTGLDASSSKTEIWSISGNQGLGW